MSHTREFTSDHGFRIRETRLLLTQYRIEYNADYVVRATMREVIGVPEGQEKLVGDRRVVAELPRVYVDEVEDKGEALQRWQRDHLVNSAEKLAEQEDRLLMSLEGAIMKEWEARDA
jgi:hypothetical protein